MKEERWRPMGRGRMKTLGAFVAGIAAIAFAGSLAAAEMYKWVDKDGVVHFQDAPPAEAPPSVRIEKIPTPGGGAPEAVSAAPDVERPPAAADPSSAPSETPAPAAGPAPVSAGAPRLKENPQVEIYGTVWCPYCAKARDFFRARGIPFADYDVERDFAAMSRKKKFDDVKGVPTVVIDGQVIHGFSEAAYLKALTVAP